MHIHVYACSSLRDSRLFPIHSERESLPRVAQGKATSDEVQRQLGTPIKRTSVPMGEALWRYEVLEEQPTYRGTPTGFWCNEYRLTFDKSSVLRPLGASVILSRWRTPARTLQCWV